MQPPDNNRLPEQPVNRSNAAPTAVPAILHGDADLRTWVIATAIAVLHAAVLGWGMVVLG